MDRLSQLRGEAGGSGDSTLDTTSPPSEAFMSANENSSKYFSINDSTFDIAPSQDVSLASTSADPDPSIADGDELISNLSPIGKKDMDSYKIGKQIEAANILSGGVDIFDGDDNSFDGDELVIDDNMEVDDKTNNHVEVAPLNQADVAPFDQAEVAPFNPADVAPFNQADVAPFNPVEEAPFNQAEVAQFNPAEVAPFNPAEEAPVENVAEPAMVDLEANVAREMEVVLQIDGNNVNAIDIGNGLYLYRKDGLDELAAIQILKDDPQHSFKFLKVRDNAQGNLEVYEEIEIEVPKEVPTKEGKPLDKNTPHVPTQDINKSMSEPLPSTSKGEGRNKSPQNEPIASTSRGETSTDEKETLPESKTEVNRNGKMMKYSESRKSPVVSTFTPVTFHSTPKKEGKPLTKTMVDLQLDPNRHSDNVKKTIEVHTENIKQKPTEAAKERDTVENIKSVDTNPEEKKVSHENRNEITNKQEVKKDSPKKEAEKNQTVPVKCLESTEEKHKSEIDTDKDKGTIVNDLDDKTQNKVVEIEPITSASSGQPIKEEIELFKPRDVYLENDVVIITDKENEIVLSMLEKSVVPIQSTSEVDNKATIFTSVTNQKVETASKPMVEQNKPVEIDMGTETAPITNKAVEKLAVNKNNLAEDTTKADIPAVTEKVQDKNKETEKDKESPIEILENISIKCPLTSDMNDSQSTVKDQVTSSIKPVQDNTIKYPLESFSEVSSTCTNLGSEESKEESITLYSIDTDESVSLITPSTTTQIRDDKVVLSKEISEVLTTINNLSNMQAENTSVKNDKTAALPVVKESDERSEKNEEKADSEADSTSQERKKEEVSGKVNCPKLDKMKTAQTSCSQKCLEVIKESIPIMETKLPEKTASSIVEAKLSENAESSIPATEVKGSEMLPSNLVPKEKPTVVGNSTMVGLKPLIKECQPPLEPAMKSTGKIAVPAIKSLNKPPEVIPAPLLNPMEKLGKSGVTKDVKTIIPPPKLESTLDTTEASVSGVKTGDKCPVPVAKPMAKASTSIHTSKLETTTLILEEGKQSQICAATYNKSVKPESHIPVVSVANKPSSKHIPVIAPRVEIILKPVDKTASQKDVSKNSTVDKQAITTKSDTREIKEPLRKTNVESRPVNNNHAAAVPFGKWTDAHRQEFVNKFKEVKAPLNTNSKQIKNSNDLNRRDVLQKIDSQRAQTISNATAKTQDKISVKSETVFSSKVVSPTVEAKTVSYSELVDTKHKQPSSKVITKQENPLKTNVSSTLPKSFATDMMTKIVGKLKPGSTSQTTFVKIEPAPREQSAVGKKELTPKEQSAVGKKELTPKEQSVVGKKEPTPKEQSGVGKKELTPKEQSAVGKKEPTPREQSTIGKKECISREQSGVGKKEPNLKEKTIVSKTESSARDQITVSKTEPASKDNITVCKTETAPKVKNTASCYMASLIDKTIEDMISRVAPGKNLEEPKQGLLINPSEPDSDAQKPVSMQEDSKVTGDDPVSLDDIEMKMNELHGIPFVERPPHELPKVLKPEAKTYSKIDKKKSLSVVSKITNTNYTTTEPKVVKDLDSDEEIIDHEPITGDLDLKKKTIPIKITSEEKRNISEKSKSIVADNKDKASNKDPEIITETEFDKFARRNSITYENSLTVNFDRKEPQNLQTTMEKDLPSKVNLKTELTRNEVKSKLPLQTIRHHIPTDKIQDASKHGNLAGDSSNKKYQSKIHSAYQSALTAKHQVSRPISIIEDKPVKVLFLESNTGFVPSQLNVQGQELSPAKKPIVEVETFLIANDSGDSGTLEVVDENKQQDKTKTKHQRKQVLTPVEEPDLELIQPSDIGIQTSPKKKRKVEEIKTKNVVPKKSYLLGRNTTTEDKIGNTPVLMKDNIKDASNRKEDVPEHKDAASAIDNLVKAAELLENQAESENKSNSPNPNTPVKRGRGRPRKYPLPEGAVDDKSPSPQKKPRLIDAKPIKRDSFSDEDDDDSLEEAIVRENWTMGKINENIVCPICNKLFRSENVVFKHVKHCTGVSPNRSDSDKKSPRRYRLSRESEDIDMDFEMSSNDSKKEFPKKRKSKESAKSDAKPNLTNLDVAKDNVILDNENSRSESKKDSANKRKSKECVKSEENPNQTKLDVSKNDVIVDCKMSHKENNTETPKKHKSIEFAKTETKPDQTKLDVDKDDVIVIEDTPIKDKIEKISKEKEEVHKKELKAKVSHRTKSLVCEFCGKTFRQQSYLTSHKLQHKKDLEKKKEKDAQDSNKSQVFSCEVCKKEFRKLHHLVQHRINHNPDTAPKRALRKSLSEQNDTKNQKEDGVVRQAEDASAGFRCEPCDKSFRKLHHLVEHRGTHDGINRQKPAAPAQPTVDKPPPPPQCEVCQKTFRKLHHLIEHKEQHADTSSDKSDDKSIKSALSTKDIIHECSLCYMVFPNEHSLNKHSGNCSRKKRQSKQLKDTAEIDSAKDDEKTNSEKKKDEVESIDVPKIIATEIIDDDDNVAKEQDAEEVKTSVKNVIAIETPIVTEVKQIPIEVPNKDLLKVEAKSIELLNTPAKRDATKCDLNKDKEKPLIPEKIKKIDHKEVKTQDVSKKKAVLKDKGNQNVTKRQKSIETPLVAVDTVKPCVESSDDDEIRYMLNPNFKVDESSEGKTFMKVRSRKRNSLQIERPNSNDHAKRRTSLQLPPKISRLKPKAVETKLKVAEPKSKAAEPNTKLTETKSKVTENKTSAPPMKLKHVPKLSEPEVLSTDSDDSDVKYSFPKIAPETKSAPERTPKEKKVQRKSLAEKRKSLGGIAKRKSLGKAITAKHKENPAPPKPIKRRTLGVEHRCDCGELFSSAALLARHTSLAHTPPRIRRPRDADQLEQRKPRKSSARSDAAPSTVKLTRKSSVKNAETPPTKSLKQSSPAETKSAPKTRRSAAHSGVPVPEKMRKMMHKNVK